MQTKESKGILSFWSKQTVGTKLSIPLTIIVLASILVVTLIAVSREQSSFEAELNNNADTILSLLAHNLREPLYLLDLDELSELASVVQSSGDIENVIIYDTNGVLLIDTSAEVLSFSQEPQALGLTLTILGDGQQYQEDRPDRFVAGVPVFVGRQLLGGLVVELSTLALQEKLTLMYQQTFVVALISILVALVLSQLFVRRMLHPLRELTTVTELLASGDYQHTVNVTSEDEIGQLGLIFNKMAIAVKERDSERVAQLETQLIEVQEARKAAEKANQVKSQFLANMSHELRTPLNAILNFNAFVADGVMGPVNDEQVNLLNQSISSGKHLLALINDVLDITKIEAGMMDLFIQEVDLSEILTSVASVGKGLVKDKEIQFLAEIEEGLPVTFGDKRRLRQVFLNVISNAIKFTDKGQVTLRVKKLDNSIRVEIQDTGLGIAKKDHHLVFQSFKQAKHDFSETIGTGLGMPISKYFVESHQGKMSFDSDTGKGSTFYVELPMLSEEEANLITLEMQEQ